MLFYNMMMLVKMIWICLLLRRSIRCEKEKMAIDER